MGDRCHLVILILCGIASSQAEQIIANQMFNHPNSTQVDYARRYEPKRCSFYNCFNGFCYYGLCVCGRGWAGNMCSQCIPRRDCIKGFCYVPGGCECEFGYYGSNCDHQGKPTGSKFTSG